MNCKWLSCIESSGVCYTNGYCSKHDRVWFKLLNFTSIFWLPLAVAALWMTKFVKQEVRSQ